MPLPFTTMSLFSALFFKIHLHNFLSAALEYQSMFSPLSFLCSRLDLASAAIFCTFVGLLASGLFLPYEHTSSLYCHFAVSIITFATLCTSCKQCLTLQLYFCLLPYASLLLKDVHYPLFYKAIWFQPVCFYIIILFIILFILFRQIQP